MKPAMYIFINRGLGMSPGKIAAQAGHAAVEASLLSNPATCAWKDNGFLGQSRAAVPALWDAWREGLHYAKYVMEARDEQHLIVIEKYLAARGFGTHLVIDEGHTEVPALTATALGVALVDKDDPHTKATFSSFKLYKDPKPPEPPATNSAAMITDATTGDTRGVTMWGYPLKLRLEHPEGTVNVTDSLRMVDGVLRVDPVKILDRVERFEHAKSFARALNVVPFKRRSP